MFTLFFTDREVTDFESANFQDKKCFADYFNSMLEQGIYLPPSPFEASFLSLAHTEEEIDETLQKAKKAFRGSCSSKKNMTLTQLPTATEV